MNPAQHPKNNPSDEVIKLNFLRNNSDIFYIKLKYDFNINF